MVSGNETLLETNIRLKSGAAHAAPLFSMP